MGEASRRGVGEAEVMRNFPGEELPCQTGGGVVHLTGVTSMQVRGSIATMAIGALINSEGSPPVHCQ